MNRQQITKAHHLFWTRDQVQARLDAVLGGSGVALMISGQGYPEALAAVIEALADHFRKELNAIDDQLRLLGWNGESITTLRHEFNARHFVAPNSGVANVQVAGPRPG